MSESNCRYPRNNLAACMLPWTEDFTLDESAFVRHVQSAIDGGYKCIYLMGTAGEGYALSNATFEHVVEVFAGLAVKDGLDPQIGVISLSMQQILERLALCYDKGIRMFQLPLPSWGALDDDELLLFFTTVCGAFPDCRFLHYNLPRAKRILTGADYRRIADVVPNLVATKNSTSDRERTTDLMTNAGDLQHFFLEGSYAMGAYMGECSLLCSMDAVFPKLTWDFFEAGVRKDMNELFRITQFLHHFCERMFEHCKREMIDGSYDKVFIWLRDPEFHYRVLPPYIGLSDDESRVCREVFEREFAQVQ